MTIRQKVSYGFVAIAILMAVLGAIRIYRQVEFSKEHAITHAEIAARVFALSIAREEEETNIPPIYTHPQNLQEYVKDFHEIVKLDLVVADRNKKILADVISHNVGTIFDHDQGNEVGQTIQDGVARTFIEKSPDYPKGIKQLVIPFKSEQGESLGAVVIEYTPFYREAVKEAVIYAITVGAIAIVSILFALILGYKISMAIANPVHKLKEAAAGIAGGDLDVRVEVETKDEIGDLAVSFNKMVSDLKKTRGELITAKEYADNIVNSMMNSLIVLSPEGKIQYVNPATCSLLAYEENEIVGQPIDAIFGEEKEELSFKGPGLAHLIKEGTARNLEKTYLSKDGKKIPVLFSMSVRREKDNTHFPPLLDITPPSPPLILRGGREGLRRGEGELKGRIQSIVCVAQDITERKQAEEALRSLSHMDELTGLFNRRQFFALAEQQLKIAIRTKKKLLLLFIDVDGLKRINDNHGHMEGDLALIDIANILKGTFRESDITARIGGDEFVVLAVKNTDVNGEIPTTRLQNNLGEHNAKGSRGYQLSISVGTTQFDPEQPLSVDELLARADVLMYEQKRGKQN
jgi:diguanylate cyclase (GGDEF)-like protein/PAS domain S-box-containing protein